MSLYEQWARQAYNAQGQTNSKLWKLYLPKEQQIYEHILNNKIEEFSFTVKGLAEQYDIPVFYVCGFVTGISDSLNNEIKPEDCTEDSEYTLEINFELLYKRMIEYKAEHLYTLPQWDNILDQEIRDKIMFNMTKGKTFERVEDKVGRNDPCPCGSGKKYKKCCGA